MRKTRSFPKNRKDEKRINEAITAPELAVISDTGEFLGKMSLSEALATAESHNLDLVEM
jgi:translation initiation factor IF-3, N-terminal domain protein